MNWTCGIDPGKSGGIALLTPTGEIIHTFKMPETEEDLAQTFRAMYSINNPVSVYCERIWSRPAQVDLKTGRPQRSGSNEGKFMMGYGVIRGILAALNFQREYVTPQVWQKALGCLTKGDKNISKDAAQRLWPRHKITHAIADALLIAEYGRRKQLATEHLDPIDLL